MIGRISGVLLEKNPPQLLIDCQGIGYEVAVPMNTFYHLPNIGEKVVLLTHLIVREDAHILYGFGNDAERQVFKLLIKISGVGARTALTILSGMSVQDLTQAVLLQESVRLMKVPGIGKKTAERLLLELKGKLGTQLEHQANSGGDILSALIALGYSDKEARLATQSLASDLSVSEGIKLALKTLSKL